MEIAKLLQICIQNSDYQRAKLGLGLLPFVILCPDVLSHSKTGMLLSDAVMTLAIAESFVITLKEIITCCSVRVMYLIDFVANTCNTISATDIIQYCCILK